MRRAQHGGRASVQHVGANHDGADVVVPEKLLNGSDVVMVLQEVGGKRVPESVAARPFCNAGATDGVLHGSLEDGLV